MTRPWIDVTVMIRPGMVVWPGDPPVEIRHRKLIDQGGSSNISVLSLGAHTGTHMDGPRHFFSGAPGLDTMPLDAVIGPARVIEIEDRRAITVEEVWRHRIRRGERILFKTPGAAARWRKHTFDGSFVYISEAAAKYLVTCGVRTVGIDYLSVGGYKKDSAETHRALLGAGVWIIEGLDLSRIRPGRYDMVALPLRILASDGAPARVALRARR